MAVPSSGELELYGDIGTELGVAQSNVTLHGMSQTAGFTPPDAMSEFYGYAPTSGSFNTVIWSGNGSTNRQITDLGFAPDWVWVKERNPEGLSHNMYDTVRGAGLRLFSNLTSAESTLTEGVKSFDINGFTVGNSIAVNRSGSNFVAWCWKAGGVAVSVPNGTGTSSITQSANVQAGFSITSYTGSVTGANKTIPHGLSTAPAMVIIKDRDWGVPNWFIWHKELSGGNYYLTFTPAAQTQNGTVFSSAPTSSVVNIGGDSGVGDRTDRYVAYCFAEVAGVSKFGSYTGNSSTNGPTVNLGFEPALLIVKCKTTTRDWIMLDNKRAPANPRNKVLFANYTNPEATGYDVNFNATSFQIKDAGSALNTSGQTYIYMAFANQF
jgi:hypothetical protein